MTRFILDWKQFLLIFAIGVGGSFATTQAQSRESYRTPSVQQERSRAQEGNAVESVPDWAEPGQGTEQEPAGRSRGRVSDQKGATTQDNHTPPGVPVDGGLIWLALGGGGYATWKLRGEKDGFSFGQE